MKVSDFIKFRVLIKKLILQRQFSQKFYEADSIKNH